MAARNGHAPVVEGAARRRRQRPRGQRQRHDRADDAPPARAAPRRWRCWSPRGADVNAVEATNGQTALMFAAARNGRRGHRGPAGARRQSGRHDQGRAAGACAGRRQRRSAVAGRGGAAGGPAGLDRSAAPGPGLRRHGHRRHDGAALRRARRPPVGGARAGRRRRQREPRVWRRADLVDRRGDHQRPSRHGRRTCSTTAPTRRWPTSTA